MLKLYEGNGTDEDEQSAPEQRRVAMGNEIRRYRRLQRVTQSELGSVFGELPPRTISQWEREGADLSCEQVRSIELYLGIELGTLTRNAGYWDPN